MTSLRRRMLQDMQLRNLSEGTDDEQYQAKTYPAISTGF